MRIPCWFGGSVALLAAQLALAQPSPEGGVMIPAKDKFHVYLLLGQSNMAGGGALPATPEPANPRILVLNPSNAWAVARDPLHFDFPGRGVGPGMSFAQTMLQHEKDPAVVIGLIPCAYSGSKLEQWQPGGALSSNAMARAQIATGQGTLKGVLWHQGESDSDAETNAVTYGTRLAQMIRDLRAVLGAGDLPFVAAQLCPAIEGHGGYPYAKVVNQALAALPTRVPRTACADSQGLANKGDGLHFTAEAQVELGQRYAAEMLKLTRSP